MTEGKKRDPVEMLMTTAQNILDIKKKHISNMNQEFEKLTDPNLKSLLTNLAAIVHYSSRLNEIEHEIMRQTLELIRD
jgi:hypothetical protein